MTANGPAPAEYGWWLASRAAGLTALLCITVAVGIGLALGGKVASKKPGLPRVLLAIHEHAALAGLIAIAVHGITLLGDAWLKPSIADIAVPFASDVKPLWVGLGVIGGYLAALLGLTLLRAQADRHEAVAQGAPGDDPRLRPQRRPHDRRGDGREGAVAAGRDARHRRPDPVPVRHAGAASRAAEGG